MSDKTHPWTEELADAGRTLRTMKDELKVQMHLGSMEAKKRFAELETRLENEQLAIRKSFKEMADGFREVKAGMPNGAGRAGSEYVTRESIMKLLSDDEVAKVGTAQSAARLSEGEEYVDLEQLDKGVRCTDGVSPSMGTVLPKKSVHAATWSKIVSSLSAPKSATNHAGSKR